MPQMIAMAYSEKSKQELIAMGFTEQTVMMKRAPGTSSKEDKEKAERMFWRMKYKPYQFAVFDYWGCAGE